MMKKPLIAAIATMAVAAGAQAESKVYGKFNVGIAYDDSSEATSLNTFASRLGVKGSDDLGSTKVVYQIELEVGADDGTAGSTNYDVDGDGNTDATDSDVFKSRNTFIGLAYEGMGTVKMGLMDTPVKLSQGKFDLFNDVYDMKNYIDGDKRLGNSVNYTSEKFGNIQASVSYVMMEDKDVDDGISASVVYKADALYAAVAIDSKTEDADTQTIRATGIYSMGDLRLGALVNMVDENDTADAEMGFGVNAAYKMGKNTAKVQFLSSDQGKPGKGATAISFGVDHKLAKTTKAYAAANLSDADAANSDVTSMVFGLVHKF